MTFHFKFYGMICYLNEKDDLVFGVNNKVKIAEHRGQLEQSKSCNNISNTMVTSNVFIND